jgi:site-specific DNA-methyltransferase (adenine-specific)
MKSGIKYYLDDGVSITDVWSDLYPVRNVSKEQLNYPTQKPLKLLERVIK